jgi:hypothetical protein
MKKAANGRRSRPFAAFFIWLNLGYHAWPSVNLKFGMTYVFVCFKAGKLEKLK